jgi:hypothetical protein
VNANPDLYFTDSWAPLTRDAVALLLQKTGGVLPLAWGRYTDQDLAPDFDVAAEAGIPVILIARRSANVQFPAAGAPNGKVDRERMEKLVEVATARGASVVRSAFLDVEQKPDMHRDYWSGWSKAFDGSALMPCVYMPNRNWWPASWLALEAAVAAGARCGGTWVALYRQATDGHAVYRDEDWARRPLASDHIPYLGWQAIGDAYGQRFDFSEPNPAALGWLADTLPAPSRIGPVEMPRADSVDPAPLAMAVQESA